MDNNNKMDNRESSYSNNDNEAHSDAMKKKRQRRSKNDGEGRNYKCTHCGKSYLSQPALTNHIKSKHKQNDPDFLKRGRGRPRKNPTLEIPEKDAILKFKHFFEKDLRQGKPGESIIDLISDAFNHLYNTYKGKIFLNINSILDHKLYRKIEEISRNTEKELENADEIFAKYIVDGYQQSNRDYFLYLVKFVVLFRECINKCKNSDDMTNDFTAFNKADSVPDMCNDFITDFMENNDYFGLEINELIEIIQHFCYWLYENKHTTSRLTLLS